MRLCLYTNLIKIWNTNGTDGKLPTTKKDPFPKTVVIACRILAGWKSKSTIDTSR